MTVTLGSAFVTFGVIKTVCCGARLDWFGDNVRLDAAFWRAETVTDDEVTAAGLELVAAVIVTLPGETAVTVQALSVALFVAVATAELLDVQDARVAGDVELPPVICTAKVWTSPIFNAALPGVIKMTTGSGVTGTTTSSPQAAKPPRAAKLTVSNIFFREKKCIRPPSFEVVEVTDALSTNPRRLTTGTASVSPSGGQTR